MTKRLRASGALPRTLLSMIGLVACSEYTLPEEAAQQSHVVDAVISASPAIGVPTTLPITISLAAPAGLSPLQPVLGASESILVEPEAEVLDGISVAMGTTIASGVHLGLGAKLAETYSRALATVGFRAEVHGTLHAAQTLIAPSAHVNALDHAPEFDPPSLLSWTVTLPKHHIRPWVVVADGGQQNLSPGSYGAVTVLPHGRLTLRSGTYYFSQLSLPPSSVVELDQSHGPVIVYVTDALLPQARFHSLNADRADLLIVYLGTLPVLVGGPSCGPFEASLIAPSALLSLLPSRGAHEGFFAAKHIVLGPAAEVRYRPPLPIVGLVADGAPRSCSELLASLIGDSTHTSEASFQTAVARYCTAPGVSDCLAGLIGRANVDYFAAAQRAVSQTSSPAQYLSSARDRTRKLRRAEEDPSVANSYCSGPDADGDWVPDTSDACPDTPELAGTDDSGCPTALTAGPSATDVQKALGSLGMVFNPRCSQAPAPGEVSSAALYQTASPDNGTFISAWRVNNQPSGCSVWYEFQIRELLHGVPVKAPYSVVFMDRESSGPVAGLGGLPALSPRLVQFNARPTDSGTRGTLGSVPLSNNRANFRVRAMSANGLFGPWSEWKLTNQQDCHALGIVCAVRN